MLKHAIKIIPVHDQLHVYIVNDNDDHEKLHMMTKR